MAGKGRAPCCDKSKVKRGPWSPAEDLRLITFIQNHGHDNWRALPKQAGLLRCGKSCRLRWINYLRPDLKRGNFTKEEEDAIIKLHQTWGNKWSKIASRLPGRTDNEIKNVWNTHLKKKVRKKLESEACGSLDNEPKESCISSSSSNSSVSYENQNSMSERPRDGSEANDPNDQVIISTPVTSDPKEVSSNIYDSNISSSSSTNDLNIYDNQVGIMSAYSPIDFGVDYDDLMMIITDGSDQNATDHQIPLEIGEDFWNMLDNLESCVSDHQTNHSIDKSKVNCQSSNLEGEVENCKPWFRYLEDELGLNHHQAITTSNENKQ